MKNNTPTQQFIAPSVALYGEVGAFGTFGAGENGLKNKQNRTNISTLKGITVETYDAIETLITGKTEHPLEQWSLAEPGIVIPTAIGAWSMMNAALRRFVVWKGMKDGEMFTVRNPDPIGPRRLFGTVIDGRRGDFQLTESNEGFECDINYLEGI